VSRIEVFFLIFLLGEVMLRVEGLESVVRAQFGLCELLRELIPIAAYAMQDSKDVVLEVVEMHFVHPDWGVTKSNLQLLSTCISNFGSIETGQDAIAVGLLNILSFQRPNNQWDFLCSSSSFTYLLSQGV